MDNCGLTACFGTTIVAFYVNKTSAFDGCAQPNGKVFRHNEFNGVWRLGSKDFPETIELFQCDGHCVCVHRSPLLGVTPLSVARCCALLVVVDG